MTTTVQQLEDILAASSASDDFKDAVQELKKGIPNPLIQYNRGVPPVKALRATTKLLEAEPALVVESLLINGTSGCSDFTGSLEVNGDEARFEFVWDCAWRAKEEKLTDHFGYPDQMRAAREFGYQCFQIFRRVV